MVDFSNISHIDFEELCRDIAGAEYGARFSAFGPGPDGGIDGRHSTSNGDMILQCKHYIKSNFSELVKAAKKEAIKVKNINTGQYLFFTSASLTPKKSERLAKELGPQLKSLNDIWGQEDIQGSLRRHPNILKSHFKLWLSSTEVIEKIVNAGLDNFNKMTKAEIIDKLKVYVKNESFEEAARILEEQKVLIITGPPGVGKTTLADMICYYYLKDDWKFCSVREIDDVLRVIDEDPKTIFYFDDFLGRIQLDRQSLLETDSTFARFIRSVRRSKNARFILTSRAHIFEEARQISDYIDDERLQLSKFLINVEKYTRKVRAYILFNHLSVSDLTSSHFRALLKDDWLMKIIDHRNYNPRAIASVTSDLIAGIDPEEYPNTVIKILENPHKIWDKPFSNLDMKSQNLLCAIYFSSEFGAEIDDLRITFNELHRAASKHYSHATYPSDFEISLKSLESGFVSISNQKVSFVNPSLKDYLKTKLRDLEYLRILPKSARRADWARSLWKHTQEILKGRPADISEFAQLFTNFAAIIENSPLDRKQMFGSYPMSVADDLSISDRICLLLEWWDATENDEFITKSYNYFDASRKKFSARRDSDNLPRIYGVVKAQTSITRDLRLRYCEIIETEINYIIDVGLDLELLVGVFDSIVENVDSEDLLNVRTRISEQVIREVDNIDDIVEEFDSESSLADHLSALESFSEKTGIDIDYARGVIEERIYRIQHADSDSSDSPDFSSIESPSAPNIFSDKQIKSLFSNLPRKNI